MADRGEGSEGVAQVTALGWGRRRAPRGSSTAGYELSSTSGWLDSHHDPLHSTCGALPGRPAQEPCLHLLSVLCFRCHSHLPALAQRALVLAHIDSVVSLDLATSLSWSPRSLLPPHAPRAFLSCRPWRQRVWSSPVTSGWASRSRRRRARCLLCAGGQAGGLVWGACAAVVCRWAGWGACTAVVCSCRLKLQA